MLPTLIFNVEDFDIVETSNSLSLRVVETLEEFISLQTNWQYILDQYDEYPPFLTWEWMYTWWEVYKTDETNLNILVISDGELVVGILPMYLRVHRSFIVYKCLYFLGTGEPEEKEICSEYLDIILLDDYVERALKLINSFYSNEFLKWDAIKLFRIIDNSHIGRVFSVKSGSKNLFRQEIVSGYRYLINLPNTWDHYLESSLKSSMRRAIKKSRQLVFGMSNLHSSRVISNDQLAPVMELLAKYHNESWSLKGKPGAFASLEFREFHLRIAEIYHKKNMLELVVTRVNEDILAILYNYKIKSTIYYYQSAFNMNQYSKLSPGIFAHSECIESAINRGYCFYDFMMGEPISYKSNYGTVKTRMKNITIYNKSLYGIIVSLRNNLRKYLAKK